MELTRVAKRLGNSAGVILPKKLLGSEVRIIVVKRPLNIKKVIMKIVSEFLSDVIGIYVINRQPVEVLVVSMAVRRTIENSTLKAIVMPLSILKKDIKNNFVLRSRLKKAKPILNRLLLSDLQKEANQF